MFALRSKRQHSWFSARLLSPGFVRTGQDSREFFVKFFMSNHICMRPFSSLPLLFYCTVLSRIRDNLARFDRFRFIKLSHDIKSDLIEFRCKLLNHAKHCFSLLPQAAHQIVLLSKSKANSNHHEISMTKRNDALISSPFACGILQFLILNQSDAPCR